MEKYESGFIHLIFVLIIFLIGILAFSVIAAPKDFESCMKFPGSTAIKMYPSTCTTFYGISFKQQISEEEKERNGIANTSEWNTYKDEEYGFEFKYPNNWYQYIPNSNHFVRFSSAPYSEFFYGKLPDKNAEAILQIIFRNKAYSFETYVDVNDNPNPDVQTRNELSRTRTTIDNKDSFILNYVDQGQKEIGKRVFISTNNFLGEAHLGGMDLGFPDQAEVILLIDFYYYSDDPNAELYDGIFDQILPTFKFRITKEKAEEIVKGKDKVQDLLDKYPNYIVDAEGIDEGRNVWNVHVYEIVDNHTATYDWYYVDIYTGDTTKMSDESNKLDCPEGQEVQNCEFGKCCCLIGAICD